MNRELKLARAKENEIKQRTKKQAKDGNLTPAQVKASLEKDISNFEFFYLGSAKILGGIGKGLAKALAELRSPKAP